MNDMCNDNRFELIEKYKKELIEATNIETAPDEMAVLDVILFRFWQMGWLDKLELPSAQPDSESGYWIVKEGETAFWDVCSKCGEKTIHRMPHFKYCPYCRRRMEI